MQTTARAPKATPITGRAFEATAMFEDGRDFTTSIFSSREEAIEAATEAGAVPASIVVGEVTDLHRLSEIAKTARAAMASASAELDRELQATARAAGYDHAIASWCAVFFTKTLRPERLDEAVKAVKAVEWAGSAATDAARASYALYLQKGIDAFNCANVAQRYLTTCSDEGSHPVAEWVISENHSTPLTERLVALYEAKERHTREWRVATDALRNWHSAGMRQIGQRAIEQMLASPRVETLEERLVSKVEGVRASSFRDPFGTTYFSVVAPAAPTNVQDLERERLKAELGKVGFYITDVDTEDGETTWSFSCCG